MDAFARAKGANVSEEGVGRWRLERKPAVFRLGVYFWTAELRGDGGLAFSERQWRPDPSYPEGERAGPGE